MDNGRTAGPLLRDLEVCILAGGKGSRLGGADKGLFLIEDKPLIEYCIERIQIQTDNITINANRNLEKYRVYCPNIIADLDYEAVGPLGGIHTGLQKINRNYICFVPCDCPLLPLDLIEKLSQPFDYGDYDLTVASIEGKYQPTFFVAKKRLKLCLKKFIAKGGRKIMHWVNQTNYRSVEFSDPNEFMNLNTPCDIKKFKEEAFKLAVNK